MAIGIPEPWSSVLGRCRAEAGDPLAGSVPPHVTLLPPTRLPAEDLAEVEEHLHETASSHRVFELHLRGTGTFRPVTDVVFVAVAGGAAELGLLQRDVRRGPLDRELAYPYHPHVTVAHGVPAERLDAAYEELAHFEARFPARGFTLFEHGPDARWRPQRDFPFAGAEAGPSQA